MMTKKYKLDPEYLFKTSNGSLLLVSMASESNEIFKFSGNGADLLLELLQADTFTFEKAQEILARKSNLKNEDLEKLWNFCLDEKIFTVNS